MSLYSKMNKLVVLYPRHKANLLKLETNMSLAYLSIFQSTKSKKYMHMLTNWTLNIDTSNINVKTILTCF